MVVGKYKTNNIYNEDCYKAIKEIPDNSIDLIITDPPYLIENTNGGKTNELGKSIQNMNNQLKNGFLTNSIDISILDEWVRVMKKINIYIWCNHKQIPMYLDYFVNKLNCNFEIIIWKKTNATPLFNNKYLTDKEYCLYFRKGGYCNPVNYESAKTVYELPINILDKKLYGHPTIKPLEIIKNLIMNSSVEGEIVLDCFLGSGTTAVACKETNRRYIGFEIDKEYFEIAKNRLNGLTKEDIKLKEMGQISLF